MNFKSGFTNHPILLRFLYNLIALEHVVAGDTMNKNTIIGVLLILNTKSIPYIDHKYCTFRGLTGRLW